MSVQIIARRYATALADVVGQQKAVAQVQPEISGWATLIKDNAGLREVLGNPTVPAEKKRKLLSTLLDRTKVGNLTANFLQVLLANGRLTELPARPSSPSLPTVRSSIAWPSTGGCKAARWPAWALPTPNTMIPMV